MSPNRMIRMSGHCEHFYNQNFNSKSSRLSFTVTVEVQVLCSLQHELSFLLLSSFFFSSIILQYNLRFPILVHSVRQILLLTNISVVC